MTDDPGQPIRDYIAKAAAEGALAAAQRLTEAIGVSLSDVLESLQGATSQATPETRTGHSSISAAGAITGTGSLALSRMGFGGTAVTTSVTHADLLGQAAEEFQVVRHADVEQLGKSRLTRNALSLRNQLLAVIVVIAAAYPFLRPEIQKYLLDEAGLAAAFAQIFSLLKF